MRLIDADAFIKDNKEALLKAAVKAKDRVLTDEQAYAVQAYILAVETLLKNLEIAPTIDPVRRGRWIEARLVSTSGGTYGVRRCSLCGADYQDVGYGWDYCPNCGAKMEGGTDEKSEE